MSVSYSPTSINSRTRLEKVLRSAKKTASRLRRQAADVSVYIDVPSGQSRWGGPHRLATRLLRFETDLGLTRPVFRSIVEGLKRLKDMEGVLSEDHVFECRRDQMQRHLGNIKALLAEPSISRGKRYE